ncbi:aminotransferase class IV [Flavobacteriales bacterium]|nr:aminotransferase class IV [Flavobacteriales bacterium]
MAKGDYIILNGELLGTNQPFMKDNRAFRFGDGVFESIRIVNGFPYNLQFHIERMLEGASVLSLEIPNHFSVDYFKGQIKSLIEKNCIQAGGKARISLFRGGEGAYFSESNKSMFFIEASHLPNNYFTLNENGLMVDIYSEMNKSVNILSKYKSINSLLPIMAANFAKKNNLQECFILNAKGKIIESISSNIFIVSNGVLYTPPLEDGCIGGIMRMNVINTAIENGVTVYENTLSPQNLLAADEIFLTNAIQGIQWVGGYKSKRYFNKISKKILDLINQRESKDLLV